MSTCATKACMLFSLTIGGKPDSNTIAGFDPITNAWKEVSFLADGSQLIHLYSAKAADLLGDPAGKVIKGKATFIHPDGKIENSDVAVAIADRNNCKYTASNRHIEDKKLPDLKAHFRAEDMTVNSKTPYL